MGNDAKDMFVKMMRRAATFSGVEIITYCVMDNHFHILLKVPKRREIGEDELKRRVSTLYGQIKARVIFSRWKASMEAGEEERVHEEQDAFRKRMYDLSEFGKTLKQRYSVWYRSHYPRKVGDPAHPEISTIEGTMWQGRFHSVLVEPTQKALTAVAAYIDMNPVRAKMVSDARFYRWSGYGAARRGDKTAKENRKFVDATLYQSIIEEKTHGFSAKVPSVSRGIAIGRTTFVMEKICETRGRTRTRTRTVAVPLAESGGLSLLCSAKRRVANA